MGEQSEWALRFGDLIAMLQAADPDNPESRRLCGDEMGALSHVIYSEHRKELQAAHDREVGHTSYSLNPDSSSNPGPSS